MKKIITVICFVFMPCSIFSQSTNTVTDTIETSTDVPVYEYVPKVIIEGKWGTGPGEFGVVPDPMQAEYFQIPQYPSSIAVNSKGQIYILDHVNNRIQKYNDNGKYLNSIAVYGCADEKGGSITRIRTYDENGDAVFDDISKNPSFIGINIVIDSKDNLYYYLKRIKDGKETGEALLRQGYEGQVWQFKNDKLVKRMKQTPAKSEGLPFSKHPASNWIQADIKQEANENFTATEKEGKRALKIKLHANEKLPGYAIYDKKEKIWKIGVKTKGKFWHYIYDESGSLLKISEVPELSEFSDNKGNYYYLETGENGIMVKKSELVRVR